MKLMLKGGQVIDPANKVNKKMDILIVDGKIAEVGANLKIATGVKVEDVSGKLVVPGLIDMHVHLREPGFEAKETIASGTRAAARGGFTSVACMPNTDPVVDNQSTVEFIKKRAQETGLVNVFTIGAISKGSKGQELAEIGDMKANGIVAVSDDGQPVANAQVMRLAMQYANMFDLTVISHCEDKSLVADGVMHEGYWSTVLGLKGIPGAAEEVMVARDIQLAELTGCSVHIAHISTAESVRLVREAKFRGVKITAEATPHHFTLTDAAVQEYDTSTKVNPPLRTAADVAAVKKGLADGTIDVIATDHAPHAPEEKDKEFEYAPFGIVGLETALGLVFNELIRPGILTIDQAIAKMSVHPAKILHLNKGTLAKGADADITVIDPDLAEIVDSQKMATSARNTPFEGWKLQGLPVITMVGGNIVMRERELVNC